MANERVHIDDLAETTTIADDDYLVVETPTETKKITYGNALPPVMRGADGTNAGAKGLVPAPSATDNTKFLRGDGTYDTPNSDFTGATSSENGTHGLVPAPLIAERGKFLKADGTWDDPANTTYSDFTGATSSAAGAHGLVPAPSAGDDDAYLKGNGTWSSVPSGSTVAATLYTIRASGWSSGRYSFEATYPSSTYNIQICICEQTTAAQRTAFANAGILGSSTSNSIVATGTVPTVDIVVLLVSFTK